MSYFAEDLFRTQVNRESTIEAIAIEVKNSAPEHDTDAEIDDDWLTRFWKLAENVSHAAIRSFLARLLVKEVSKPGAISPLTLNVLSTLTPQVAQRFERFCRLSIRSGNDVYVIHPEVFPFQNIGPLDKFGVSYDDLYEFEILWIDSIGEDDHAELWERRRRSAHSDRLCRYSRDIRL